MTGTTERTSTPDALRAGSIGLAGVIFFVIATVAPMSGTIGALPVAFGLGTGAGTPGAFVISPAPCTRSRAVRSLVARMPSPAEIRRGGSDLGGA